MDIAQFRIDFPEFSDIVQYPDSQIVFWSNLAQEVNKKERFGNVYTYVIELYTAHELTLARDSQNSAAFGGLGGLTSGAKNVKTVGTTSYSYDSVTSSEQGAGYYNQTTYGRQYFRLMTLYSVGAYQV